MNKNAIQRFAIWARKELIAQVSQRAYQYDITEEDCSDYNAVAVGGRVLTDEEKRQRQELIVQIRRKGYTQVMEEVAYTWFNRFIALRFMEVNNYLPTHIRVFSDASGAFKPEILNDTLHLDLPGLDMEKVADLIERTQTEDLYRYLLLTQCNALSTSLPRMFEKMGSYTELLLPNNILRQDGILGHMVADIQKDDWTDQVQIIGWLYQYYNTELKDETFALLKKNVKITKERIPSATQLFTPDWIVRYMVENSLGRLWIEGHPDDELKAGWKYYLDEAEQEPEVQAQLEEIRAEYRTLRPQDIKVIDPCMGSGHILVYAFDVLIQIYKKAGFSERDAAQSILENNLYGLDIDDRAAQLAYFAVMMKARQYDRRIFSRNIQPHVYAIVESNDVQIPAMWRLGPEKEIAEKLIAELKDAKEYGSILNPSLTLDELMALRRRLVEMKETSSEGNLLDRMESAEIVDGLSPLVQVAEMLVQKYDVVVTNPPYMGASNMNGKLNQYIKDRYTNYKSDFFSAFIVRATEMTKQSGYCGFFTPYVWMFIQSYEKLRDLLCKQKTIETLIQFEYSAFEEATVPVCTFAFKNSHISKKGYYFRLTDFRGGMEVQRQKTLEAIANHNCGYYYETNADNFSQIPGSPMVYWLGDAVYAFYKTEKTLSNIIYSQVGSTLGDNNSFLRFWYEVSPKNRNKWIYSHKGGAFRRWYGNLSHVVNWENNGAAVKYTGRATIRGERNSFQDGITWTQLTAGKPSFRIKNAGTFIESASCMCRIEEELKLYLLGVLNSKVAEVILCAMNPTMHFQPGDIGRMPWIMDKTKKTYIDSLVRKNIEISKADWDSFEISSDFQRHPLIPMGNEYKKHFIITVNIEEYEKENTLLAECYKYWEQECEKLFQNIKFNEEELNRIFINIYGLQDELTPEVEDKDVTVRRANFERDIRSLISYAVGCMFGRYSVYKEGLLFAGEPYTLQAFVDKLNERADTVLESEIQRAYQHEGIILSEVFSPDIDNIVPICDDDYFDDDITGRFVKWVEVVYGKETLEENLKFIADALGGKGSPREVIRNYFLNDFYADHLKIYQKRPIYWLFDSGKKNGFKALIYMHRYQSDLLARMRTDYVHEQQERYRTQLKHIGDAMDSASASERVKLVKQQKKFQEQALELQRYEEKIHHLADQNIKIDLDDGVKYNYALFADVLAKIK